MHGPNLTSPIEERPGGLLTLGLGPVGGRGAEPWSPPGDRSRGALVHAGAGQVNEGAALFVSVEAEEASGRVTLQRDLAGGGEAQGVGAPAAWRGAGAA